MPAQSTLERLRLATLHLIEVSKHASQDCTKSRKLMLTDAIAAAELAVRTQMGRPKTRNEK